MTPDQRRGPIELEAASAKFDSRDAGTSQELSREVFRGLYPRLRAYAATCAGPGVDPDDLVQDALCRALATGSFAHLEEPLHYLMRAVSNLASNQRRNHSRWQRRVASLEVEVHQPAYPSDAAAIIDILRPLNTKTRSLVYLIAIEGYTAREAADVVGISYAAARARLSRARRAIGAIHERLEVETCETSPVPRETRSFKA